MMFCPIQPRKTEKNPQQQEKQTLKEKFMEKYQNEK